MLKEQVQKVVHYDIICVGKVLIVKSQNQYQC